MSRIRSLQTLGVALLVSIVAILVVAPGARAQNKYRVLHTFTRGNHGYGPLAGLIFDQAGNLYGTTSYGGGASNSGLVFKLAPNPSGGWRETVLYSFCSLMNCSDGAAPLGVLIFDAAGNLYGTTLSGGDAGGGVVFKLTPNPDGSWSESVLHKFEGAGYDGSYPDCGLVFDQAGNLYGTTAEGGTNYYFGTVFRLTPNPDGSWTESVLYSFCSQTRCDDGDVPHAGVIFDKAGNLYGTTVYGGLHNAGAIFKLTPNGNGDWTESVLYSFTGRKDGGSPNAAVILDQAGNLYGTTFSGGDAGGGVVFKLTPNQDKSWSESVLYRFPGSKQGSNPNASLIFDTAGNLHGTTILGGDLSLPCKRDGPGCGVVFKLAPKSNGGWSETVLHRFHDHPGAYSYAGLVFDRAGNLYGTTFGDDATTFGSVFEITP